MMMLIVTSQKIVLNNLEFRRAAKKASFQLIK
jgi:hypothetical protein